MSVVSPRCEFLQLVEQEEPEPKKKKRLRRAQQAEQEVEEPGTAGPPSTAQASPTRLCRATRLQHMLSYLEESFHGPWHLLLRHVFASVNTTLHTKILREPCDSAGAAPEVAEEPEEAATAADRAFIDDEGVEEPEQEQRAASVRCAGTLQSISSTPMSWRPSPGLLEIFASLRFARESWNQAASCSRVWVKGQRHGQQPDKVAEE